MRRRIRLGAAFAALIPMIALPGLAWADQTPEGQIADVQTQPGTVQFMFSAGNLPKGAVLDPDSVVVTAGGRTLEATGSLADAAIEPRRAVVREVVVALDVSGSMKGEGIAAAKSAALTYAKSLPADVQLGLVAFSDRPTTILKPTTNRRAVAQALSRLSATGETALYDAVVAAATAMRDLPSDADRRLLILSDGEDTASSHGIADVTSALVTGHIAADVVAFRLPGTQRSLERIAAASHGQVLPASNADGLARAFSTAAQAFRQQVLVTAKVPGALANATTDLKVTLNAGGASVAADLHLTLPDVPSAGPTAPAVTEPAAAQSQRRLWITVAVSFIGLLAVALAALFLPVSRHDRAQKNARIAEMLRYRMVGAVGYPEGSLAKLHGPSRSAFTERALALADRTVRARGRRKGLVSQLDRAGLRIRPEEWAVIQVLAVIFTGAVLGLLSRSVVGFAIGGFLAWLGCRLFIRYKTGKRAAAFAEQLPDTLQLLASSLRTGFSLNQALMSVVRQGTEPTASELTRALTEVRLGAELEDALDDVADRMTCEDLAWVVIAIRISREVGGNLAEVLGNTVGTMRQRAELRGQVRVLSAEGRISARVLTALPLFILGYLALVNPSYVSPLFHTGLGVTMLVFGAALLGIGAFWLSRLVKIKV